MGTAKLVVLGSINADHILNIEQFPQPGETVRGNHYQVAFGGKGANQAVAAGRSGADITFIACVGDDSIGQNIKKQLETDSIHIECIDAVKNETTGVALIFVNQQGENVIGIHAGANAHLTTERVNHYQQKIIDADAVLMQLESPIEAVQLAAEIAQKNNTKVILNPAPAQALPDSLLALVDIITPNETEAEHLTGIAVNDDHGAQAAAQALHDKGISKVIITLGARGVWFSEKGKLGKIIAGFKVKAVDTIAAGDTFNGAYVTALLEGKNDTQAVRFAHAAAAIAVTRAGAQPSVPWRNEIDTFLTQQE
ncbi:ribokinase [Providencia stuartii]|uniref:Ribokinase n=1 Tax=Providencia stuartii TaxID=588 RepID=A0A1S1HMJ5_PROST|nr:ribokinase [Providencia sp. 2023EL-00965]ELR5114701.1 ribokinase [Providencia stuartii]MDV5227166.1 ribokinase [Providencia rettgeri]ELR5301718.1 ribokinase [Providencia stuartii]MDW7590094.1 ribokinase [Providencia sp. 2023EL-00965]OHT22483.1 ribokinase [Providencia stuartii]